jgi:catechol 2,3-dioxygenase-like lactoylglutathione lyase family enzyme
MTMSNAAARPALSVMLIVSNTAAAVSWYTKALGAGQLWDLDGVAGLHLDSAPFFLHEAVPGKTQEPSPTDVGLTTTQAPTRLRGTSPPVIRCREPWITTKVDYICRSPPGGGDRLGAGGHRASLTVGAPQGDGLPVPSVCDGRYLSTPGRRPRHRTVGRATKLIDDRNP